MTQANTTNRKPMMIAIRPNGPLAKLRAEYAAKGRLAEFEAVKARYESGTVDSYPAITPKPFAVAYTSEDECARWYASQKTA